MANFNLSSLADRLSQVISENANISSVFGKNDRAIRELFSNLSNGETILAKVLSVSEGSFQISTGNNVIINAKSENNVELTPGSTVLLEVNKFSNDKVSLRPLYLNTNYEETARTALNQAGISENPRALELVARSMEYGKPIDRDSLLLAYRDVIENPDVPVKYLVDLRQMGLEINKANIEGFENYMNMKNLVSDSFKDISNSLAKELILSINNQPEGLKDDNILNSDITINNFDKSIKYIDSVIYFFDDITRNNKNDFTYSFEEISNIVSKIKESNINTTNLDVIVSKESDDSSKNVLKALLSDLKNNLISSLDNNEEAKMGLRNVSLEHIFKDNSVKDLIYNTLSSSWSVPESDLNKKEIKDLINRLYNESHNLLNSLENTVGHDSKITEMVDNLNRNLDFMEQINQYIPYIQIPFNSENGSNTGELYVYKNKKKLTEGDSELTAFLHLDMDNLGPTDIYVSLKYNNVSTNFKLANEESLKLINDNIDFLNKRLEDKGYSLRYEMSVDNKRKPPLQEMIFENENHLIVSKNSFDARV